MTLFRVYLFRLDFNVSIICIDLFYSLFFTNPAYNRTLLAGEGKPSEFLKSKTGNLKQLEAG